MIAINENLNAEQFAVFSFLVNNRLQLLFNYNGLLPCFMLETKIPMFISSVKALKNISYSCIN